MLGIVLDEAYLSMGYKSRHIWCLPRKDSTDHDCHVVNAVYSMRAKKWIMMDATNEAYFVDQKNAVVGLQEVRAWLRAGKQVRLNKDANWNGKPLDSADHIRYMAKNVYEFQCGLRSEFGYDGKAGAKSYVYLLPNAEKGSHKGDLWVENGLYYTTNPRCFWAEP